MANIRVDVPSTIHNGSEVIFLSPCDCSQISGLSVYYLDDKGKEKNQSFVFKDAHGYELNDVDNLFTIHVYVKVILNVTDGIAYIQNADTNKYLEARFKELEERSRITAQDGATYEWGIDEEGVFIKQVTSDDGELDTYGMLKFGDEDTGYFVDIDGNMFNVQNLDIDDDKLV